MNKTATELIQEITQAALALMVVGGCVIATFVLILRGDPATQMPDWLTLALGAVVGFYFGARNSAPIIASLTNGPMTLVANASSRRIPGVGRRTDETAPEPITAEATTNG